MRIAIVGTGGIGAPLGASLATAGQDVVFLARGAHLTAMRRTACEWRATVAKRLCAQSRRRTTPLQSARSIWCFFALSCGMLRPQEITSAH